MELASTITLLLNELEDGLPGISPAWGRFLCEASSCCFDSKNHSQGVEMFIHGYLPTASKVFWSNDITEQVRRSWNDVQELTEYAATGVALLLTVKLTEFTVIERAPKDGGGFDYWLGHKDSEIFEKSARLEISGILEETEKNKISTRLKFKENQVRQRASAFPAYIIIVEFGNPVSQMERK